MPGVLNINHADMRVWRPPSATLALPSCLYPPCPTRVVAGRDQLNVAIRVVMDSIRSVSISTPIPGPVGTAMCPSATVNSGDTISECQ